jgi:hypothetical protein
VVGGQDPDGLGLTEQLVASLHERLFHLGDLFEESFGYGSLLEDHSLSARISSGEPEGRNLECTLHAHAPTLPGIKIIPYTVGMSHLV